MLDVEQGTLRKSGLGQRLQLSPHVCYCETATGIIFLDLNRNRYFGIGAEEGRLFCALMHMVRQATPPSPPVEIAALQSLAHQLVQQGLITQDESTQQLFETAPIRLDGRLYSAGQELEHARPVRAMHVLNFTRAYVWAKLALRHGPLLPIAHHLYAEKRKVAAPGSSSTNERTVALVSTFRRIRPYVFAARGQCLLRVLTLTKFLLLCGAQCTWVIGVRTKRRGDRYDLGQQRAGWPAEPVWLERGHHEQQRQGDRDGLREDQPDSAHERKMRTPWPHAIQIETTLNTLLAADSFNDYGPNGLQIEGAAQVRRIVSGVTASLDLIDAAIADGADAILVHHGLFWRGQDGRLVAGSVSVCGD